MAASEVLKGPAPLQITPGRMEEAAVGLEPCCCKGKEWDQAEGAKGHRLRKEAWPVWDLRAVPAQGQTLNHALLLGPVHSRGKVLITRLIISERLSVLTCAVPFVRGKTIKQDDMNNLLACLDDSCQDQQSRVIYLSTCVISFFFFIRNVVVNVSDISDGI